MMDNIGGSLAFSSDLDNDLFIRKLAEMEAKIKGTTGTLETEGGKWDGIVKNIAIGMAGAFTFNTALQFREKLIQVRGEFQKYEAVLANSLGSQEDAAESMQMLSNITANTPLQLNSLTDSYIKLVNQGFKPTREEIVKLGDLALTTDKSFEQMAEAVLSAQHGQFQKLKDFGIIASEAGDQIAFSFRGVTTTVEDSGDAIRDYIISLGDLDGVKGSMDAISGSLLGQVSDLQDSISGMFNKMGKDSQGFLTDSIVAIRFLVDNYESIGKTLGAIIATYGTYKAAVIAVTVIERTRSALMVGDIATKQMVITWEGIHAAALGKLKLAYSTLNATMLANPYVAVATLLMGVAAAAWALNDGLSAAERAQKEYNDRKEQAIEVEQKHRAEVDKLISTLTDQAVADLERVSALEKLKQKYPEIFAQYDIENIKLADILKLKQQISDHDSKNQKVGNQVQYLTQLKKIADIQKDINSIQSDVTLPPSARDASIRGLKESLKKEQELLRLYDKDVQTDRVNTWTSTLNKLTDIQLKAELEARKTALVKMQAQDATTHKITGGGAFGSFDEAELKAQTASLERELAKRNEATFTASTLQAKYQKELTQLEQERLKILSQKLTEGDLTKQLAEIDSKISAVEKKKKALEGKSSSSKTKEVEVVEFDYTDTLAKSFSEATKIIETETDKWFRIISEATQAELDQMVEIADAESEVAQRKAELQAEALEQSRTLSEELSRIKTEYAAKEAALIASNAEFMPEKLAVLKKLQDEEIASVVGTAMEIMKWGKQKLKAFLSDTQIEIQKREANGESVDELKAKYESAKTALENLPANDPFEALTKSLKAYQNAVADDKTDNLVLVFENAKEAARELENMVSGVVDIMVQLGAISSEEADGANQTASQIVGLFEGGANIAMGIATGNPIQIVQGVIQAVDNGIKLLDVKTKRIEKSQKGVINQIKEMDQAYKKLDDSLKNATGTDVYRIQLEKYKLNANEMMKYDELIQLEMSKKKKKRDQESIDAWNQEKERLKQDNEEILSEINIRLTGTTADSITQSITDGFANGKSGIAAFADTFEDLMRNALLESLKVQALEGPMQAWYKMFADGMKDGTLNPDELKALQSYWDNMLGNYESMAKEMEAATGIDLQKSDGSSSRSSSLSGDIKGVTEETASVLAGQINAIRMGQFESMEMIRGQLFHLANISSNTFKLHSIEEKLTSIDAKTQRNSPSAEMI